MMSNYRWLPVVTAIFVTSLIISNIIAVKLISLGPLFLTSAIIIFPISYIFGDILTEVYGYGRARQVIWTGFGCNLLAVIAIWISIELPTAPFWHMGTFDNPQTSQQAFEAVLGFTPRLLIASFIAYLFGEFLNSFVLAKMKIATAGKYLWMRTIGSTLIGQLADTGIFILVAFFGVIPTAHLFTMVVTQWLVKSLYEASATPLTYIVVNFLKRAEKEDFYDRETKFSPFAWDEKSRV
jgi:uncharacterized integral membrane protein (TIGR00697 family)